MGFLNLLGGLAVSGLLFALLMKKRYALQVAEFDRGRFPSST